MNQHIIAEKVSKALLQLGLTEKEVAVYVALLEKGASSVQEISRFSEINRVTIYAAIDALKRKGLVAESKKGKRTLFIAEHPENLNGILELKKEKLNHQEKILSSFVIPNLSALNINQQDKPEIQFFEGAESMGRVFDNYTLKHKDIIGCGSYETAAVAIDWEE
jgi:predicted DNA-binding transcriptional regulator